MLAHLPLATLARSEKCVAVGGTHLNQIELNELSTPAPYL
jgi:hypothetical protein